MSSNLQDIFLIILRFVFIQIFPGLAKFCNLNLSFNETFVFRGQSSDQAAAQANTEPDEKNILDEGEWGANP